MTEKIYSKIYSTYLHEKMNSSLIRAEVKRNKKVLYRVNVEHDRL